ncbi:MAG: ATP-grasp domain-containing protein [Deltaproteobacteria bacterium]|nr:ATP-grasp domain-containing protein [Deltaproteobacteria bacterium]
MSFHEATVRVLDVPPAKFRKLIVMEHLPAQWFSLDCLVVD